MAEAEKAAAEWAEAVQRLKTMTRGKEKQHVAPECPHCSGEMQWSGVGCSGLTAARLPAWAEEDYAAATNAGRSCDKTTFSAK